MGHAAWHLRNNFVDHGTSQRGMAKDSQALAKLALTQNLSEAKQYDFRINDLQNCESEIKIIFRGAQASVQVTFELITGQEILGACRVQCGNDGYSR